MTAKSEVKTELSSNTLRMAQDSVYVLRSPVQSDTWSCVASTMPLQTDLIELKNLAVSLCVTIAEMVPNAPKDTMGEKAVGSMVDTVMFRCQQMSLLLQTLDGDAPNEVIDSYKTKIKDLLKSIMANLTQQAVAHAPGWKMPDRYRALYEKYR